METPPGRNILNAMDSYSSLRPFPKRTGYRSSINSLSSLDQRDNYAELDLVLDVWMGELNISQC